MCNMSLDTKSQINHRKVVFVRIKYNERYPKVHLLLFEDKATNKIIPHFQFISIQ